jgi:hypothetical protein
VQGPNREPAASEPITCGDDTGRADPPPDRPYQGRFKCFPMERDPHLYQVTRYVERNALRANLVRQPQDGRWSSLWLRQHGTAEQRGLLAAWPLPEPVDWLQEVNEPQTEAELDAIRRSVMRGQPFGSSRWVRRTAKPGFEIHAPQTRPPAQGESRLATGKIARWLPNDRNESRPRDGSVCMP